MADASREDSSRDKFHLLFYGNFVHDPTENELRVDMVKFSRPVHVREVRVIPKSAIIHPDIPEADKIGRTTPSEIDLDFFVNDANNILAPYYNHFGKLLFSVERIALKEAGMSNIWSDTLLVRGYYKTITICVYGTAKHVTAESGSPKPGSSLQNSMGGDPGKSPLKRKWPEDEVEKPSDGMLEDELFEPFSPDHSPTMFDIFDDDIGPPTKRANTSGYEEFSDEEIAFGDDDFDQEGDLDIYADDMDLWFTSSVSFNPYQCNLLDEKVAGNQSEMSDIKEAGSVKRSLGREAAVFHDAVSKESNVTPIRMLEFFERFQDNLSVLLEETSKYQQKDIVQTVVGWICSALDLEKVAGIPTGIDVRLVKVVLKVVSGICDSRTSSLESLLERNVMDLIVRMICGDKLALSLKLEAINVLGMMIQDVSGVEYLLGENIHSEQEGASVVTLYQQLVRLCITTKSVQLVTALKSLLKRVHIYEVIVSVKSAVERLVSEEVKSSTGSDDVLDGFSDQETDIISQADHLNWYLEEIKDFIVEETIHSPILAVSFCKEGLQSGNSNFSFISSWLTSRSFLECLLVLMASPSMMMKTYAAVKDFLLVLLTFSAGLKYLQDHIFVLSKLVTHLCQEAMDEDIPYNTAPPLTDLLKNVDSAICCPHYVGILIIYHMEVLRVVQELKQPSQSVENLDDPKYLNALHTLYSITLTQAGRHCVASIISMEDYSAILLPFIKPTGEASHDSKLQKQCLSTRYVLLLLIQLIQEPNIPFFFVRHASDLLSVGQLFKDNQSSSLSSVHKWTMPLKYIGQHHDNPHLAITPLMEFIMEESSKQGSFKSIKTMQPLLMALKLVWFLVSCPSQKKQALTKVQMMKSVLELMSCDGVARLGTLLQKAVDTWIPFWRQHQVPNVSIQRCLVTSVILNLNLIKAIFEEFTKDTTCQLLNSNLLKTLFTLHMVFCTSPIARVFSQVSDEIEELVVDILSLYTCAPHQSTSKDKECEHDSWSMLLKDLISVHISSSPQSCLNGLGLLSQLLPLPLPVGVPKGVPMAEVPLLSASRTSWEAHLEPLMDTLLVVLKCHMGSCSPELHVVIRRVLVKLADISCPLAMSVSSFVLRYLLDALGEMETDANTMPQQVVVQLLSTLAVIVQQPSMKLALSEALYSKKQNYGRILPSLLKLLKNNQLQNAENTKICILTFLNALCDMTVAFPLNVAAFSPQTVANNVPPTNWLFLIIDSTWTMMTDLLQPFSISVCALKLLISATEYDQGIATLESILVSDSQKLQPFVEHLISNLQSSADVAKDVCQCTSLFLQFLDSLLFDIDSKRAQLHSASLSTDPDLASALLEEDDVINDKSILLQDVTRSELQSEYVKLEELKQIRSLSIPAVWLRDALMPVDGTNLLQDLSSNVKEQCDNKQELSEFVKSVEEFVKSLSAMIEERADACLDHSKQHSSNSFPVRLSIEDQFKDRAFVMESSAGMSSLDLWLPGPPVDEVSFFDQYKVVVDLNQLAADCCPNINLDEELKKQMLASPPHSPKHRFRKPKSNMLAERQRLRKEALLRQGPFTGRGKDLFRNRKSTTSRAPSMHVDDFVKLGQQSRLTPSLGPYGLHPYMHGISGGPFLPSHLAPARSWSGVVPSQFRTQDFFLRMQPHLAPGMRPGGLR